MRTDDPRRDPQVRNHYVYRYYDLHGVLLYVGCTMRPEKRWREHQQDRREMSKRVRTVRMQGPYNYDTAREIERVALRTERPVYAVTPQDQAAKQRRRGWIKRHMRPYITPDMTGDEYAALYKRFARKAARIDWLGAEYERRAA